MKASERLRELDGAMTPGPWGIWEYSDDSVYIESGSEGTSGGSVQHGEFVVELRENTANKLDDLADACALRNALPLIADVVEAAEKFEAAYQQSLGSASAYDVTVRDGAQFKLRGSLTALRDALEAR